MRIVQITGIFSLFLIGFSSWIPFQVESQVLDKGRSVKDHYLLSVPEFHFELTFPVKKSYVIPTTTVQDGINLYHYIAQVQNINDENLAYQIDYNHLDSIDFGSVKQMFDDQRDYVMTELISRLKEFDSASEVVIESEEEIDLYGIPGRYFISRMRIPSIDDILIYHKWYYTDGILYRLTIMTRDPKFPNKSALVFFDSFKILKK
ncbi:hypothetical protein [uncultured Fluviicola sp.]|uniref:hypothetical protein n=1 Tax=uncultured Fluviicola sp. TaxID=463303 RepID=UPI0025F484C2|nr:hypothetical protein [uncultured Fluviicola sp.]